MLCKQSQIHTQSCLEGSRIGKETLGRDWVRMGRVKYTPSRFLKEITLARNLSRKTGIGWAELDTHPFVT
jgi:hypothetical protein